MGAILSISDRLRRVWGSTLLLMLLFYVAYHAFQGDRGLLALRDLNRELAALEVKADAAKSERQRLEGLVQGLRPDHIDPDLLDERARAVLGVVKDDEYVILLDPRK